MQSFNAQSDWCFPYTGANTPAQATCSGGCGQSLNFKTTNVIRGFARINSGVTETQIMQELFDNGPMTASIYCGNTFSAYRGGVITQVEAPPSVSSTNHIVSLVGWGTDPTAGNYWLVKNSWGPGWGENGYFRIRRGQFDLNFGYWGFDFGTPIFGTNGVPSGCTLTCANMGELKNNCACNCKTPWTGTDCSTCGANCGTGGTLDPNNCTCSCQSGFFGLSCETQISSTATSYASSGGVAFVSFLTSDPNFHAGDTLIVGPPTPQGSNLPTINANINICGPAVFPFVNCPPGQVTINVNLQPGTYTAWIQRYLGNNEFGVSKGWNIGRQIFAPEVTVT